MYYRLVKYSKYSKQGISKFLTLFLKIKVKFKENVGKFCENKWGSRTYKSTDSYCGKNKVFTSLSSVNLIKLYQFSISNLRVGEAMFGMEEEREKGREIINDRDSKRRQKKEKYSESKSWIVKG